MTATTTERLVADYLARLEAAAAALPPDRRAELLEEIGGHIDGARAAGAAADEAAVRTLLDRLGPPEVIVAAAADDDPAAASSPAPVLRPPSPSHELAAVLFLTAGSFVPVLGWLVGAVLLWTSRRWSTGEKLLGTLVVPLGPGGLFLAGAVLPLGQVCAVSADFGDLSGPVDGALPGAPVETCTGFSLPLPLGIALLVLALVAPVVVAVVLYRRAAARAAAEPPVPVAAATSVWGGLEIAAVLTLALGGVVVPVLGTLVGLVLVWSSPRWTTLAKGLATAVALGPLLVLAVPFYAFAGIAPLGVGLGGVVALSAVGPLLAAGGLALALRR
ncbi:MAG TPA: hypothetical protein VM433_00690 [Mycobacteriales bacterium]|nr:hypothetical protein [Mycobacteriales bacterium]